MLKDSNVSFFDFFFTIFFFSNKFQIFFLYYFTANEYFYVEPNRYVFPGAEVYDNDDESDISSRNSDSGSDTDSDDEAENSDAAAASPPTEDKTKSTEENIPTAPPLIQENQTLENQPENIQTSN